MRKWFKNKDHRAEPQQRCLEISGPTNVTHTGYADLQAQIGCRIPPPTPSIENCRRIPPPKPPRISSLPPHLRSPCRIPRIPRRCPTPERQGRPEISCPFGLMQVHYGTRPRQLEYDNLIDLTQPITARQMEILRQNRAEPGCRPRRRELQYGTMQYPYNPNQYTPVCEVYAEPSCYDPTGSQLSQQILARKHNLRGPRNPEIYGYGGGEYGGQC